jgi:hypothetical protein
MCGAMAAVMGACVSDRTNPYENPDNAKIEPAPSLSNMTGTLVANTAYACSLHLYLPALIDSAIVRVGHGSSDSVVYRAGVGGSSPVVFLFSPLDTGTYRMQAVIVKSNGAKDSLVAPKTFTVTRPVSPEIVRLYPRSDSLMIQTAAYRCSVFVAHPTLADSFAVIDNFGGRDSLIAAGKQIGAFQPDTGLIIFPVSVTGPGKHLVRVYVLIARAVKDSLVKSIIGRSVPQVTPVASSYAAQLGDSVVVKFHVVSRDSNLLGYSTFLNFDLDSASSGRIDVMYPLISRVGDDTISRKFKGKVLLKGLTGPLLCHAQAVDRSYAFSVVASCSIFVHDTIRPRLRLLPPHTAAKDSIKMLPDSVMVCAVDAWGVDSVTMNGAKMVFVNDSVAKMVVASLPQGVTAETIIAWDKAGNTDTVVLKLAYGGPPTYPPKIRPLDKSVREGRAFDTLFLDTCVIVTDPSISDIQAYKAALVWSITDSAGNQVPSYNGTTRRLVVPVKPDSEWVDTFSLNFKVVAPNGLDVRVGVFMVNDVPDPPIMNVQSVQAKLAGNAFDTLFLDTCAKDPDNAASSLMWSFKNGRIFRVDSIFTGIKKLPKSSAINPVNPVNPIFSYFTRKIAIVPIDTTKGGGAAWTGLDTLQFTVRDAGGLSQKKPVIFQKSKIKFIDIDTSLIKPIFSH